jgi:hypothetical protein
MKNAYFFLLGLTLFIAHPNSAQSTGAIYFTFSSDEEFDDTPSVDAILLDNNEVVIGATSERDGSLFMKQVASGTYTAKLFPEGMRPILIDSVVVDSNDITHIPVQLTIKKKNNNGDAIDVVYKFSKSVSPLIQLFK